MKKLILMLSTVVFVTVSTITFVNGFSMGDKFTCGGTGKYRWGTKTVTVKKKRKTVKETIRVRGPEICNNGTCPAGEGCGWHAEVITTIDPETRVETNTRQPAKCMCF